MTQDELNKMTERIPQVGDHVILRFVGERWEISDMRKFLGTEQEIGEVFTNVRGEENLFHIKNGDGWTWRPVSIECWLDDLADPPDDTEISDFLGLRS